MCLPFGAGVRTCIGSTFALQEATLVLATIMRRFQMKLAPGSVVWPQMQVTLRPEPVRTSSRTRGSGGRSAGGAGCGAVMA